jgi:acyl carrier protein
LGKILGVQFIGTRDNFFELGGHSLLVMRLLTEVEKVFGKNLSISTFVEGPTIKQQATLLRQQDGAAPWRSLVMIQPGSTKPPLFCIHAVLGTVLFYQNLVRYLEPEQPFYALQARGLDSKQVPHTSISEMAAHYIEEIQTVQPEGPYFIGGYSLAVW